MSYYDSLSRRYTTHVSQFMSQDSGFKMQDSRCRTHVSHRRIHDTGCRIQDARLRIHDSCHTNYQLRITSSGCQVSGFWFQSLITNYESQITVFKFNVQRSLITSNSLSRGRFATLRDVLALTLTSALARQRRGVFYAMHYALCALRLTFKAQHSDF